MTAAARDTISGFVQGDDRINLSSIDASTTDRGNQAFTFIGPAAFTAEGQVRAFQAGGNMFVAINVTGIATGESQIQFTGLYTLTELDFIL